MSTIKVNTITTATNSEVEVGVPLKILETSAPSATDTHGMLYVKSDGKIYYRHTTGTSGGEVDLTAASTGGVVTSSSNAASATNALVLYSGTGAGGIKSIAGITFDGSDLSCAANIDITGDHDLSLKDDEQKIMFGADEDIYLQHDHDRGLKLIHQTGTGSGKPIYLTLQSRESDISVNDKIGVIDFQTINEGTGSDAILVAAGIEAVSEGDFASDNNATKLSFKTASSEAASEKMSLSSTGLLTVSGRIITDDDTQATGTTNGSLQTDGGLSVVKDGVFGGDLKLKHDGSVLYFGADNDTSLTHTDGTGLTLNSDNKLCFGDTGTYIYQSADGVLDLVSDNEIELNGTTVDINGAVDISGATTLNGDVTLGNATTDDIANMGKWVGSFVPKTDNSIDLGASSYQFRNAYFKGTLEADTYTVGGVTLSEYIADTVGAMFSGNTETRISATYEDSDNTIDLVVDDMTANAQYTAGNGLTLNTLEFDIDAEQTTITSILATDLKIGEDNQTKIDFEDANKINFYTNNSKEVELAENSLSPGTSNGTALGTTSLQWSDLFLAEGGVINWDNGDMTLTQTNNVLQLGGGDLDMNNQVLDNAVFQSYRETVVTPSISSNEVEINLALGNIFKVSVNAAITNFDITNLSTTANQATSFTLILIIDGTNREVDIDELRIGDTTNDYTVKWMHNTEGSGPENTHLANNTYVYTYTCLDGDAGTPTWYGFVSAVGMT